MTLFSAALTITACGGDAGRAESGRVSAERVRGHIAVLAADSLGGRDTPSDGLDRAASYAAARLRELGWTPLGDGGSFEQRWPNSFTRLATASTSLSAEGCGSTAAMRVGPDMAAMYAGEAESRGRPIVMDSIEGRVPVRGRFIVMRTDAADPSAVVHRVMQAARAGAAAGLVVVAPDGLPAMASPRWANGLSMMDHSANGISAAIVSRSAWAALSRVIERCAEATLVWRGPARRQSGPAPNVVALLRGSDARLAREYVVLSAHLDHNGVGVPDSTGDAIYNGADDNASGVAAVLAAAHTLAANPPKRSVVVLLPSGEEQGMRGTMYFVDHAPIDTAAIVANVNVDGVGRAWQKDTVSAVGADYSSLGAAVATVSRAHPELALTVVSNQWPELRYFETSDQIVFARKGVPSIFFSSTGPDTHYHQPSDEVETIDADHVARVAELVHLTVRAVADAPAAPAWDPAARRTIVGPATPSFPPRAQAPDR